MAGDWIKMRNDLADDPAVIGIASKTGLDEFAVVGRLQHLWSWADRQSRDGHAAGVTGMWVDKHVRCDGFAQAMAEVGWLSIKKGGIDFPNFDRHNGESAKKRALATGRKAKQRAAVTQVSAVVSRMQRDESVTREEKRREEKDKAPSRKTSIPSDFGISERVAKWAAEKGYGNLQAQLEALVSHAKRNGAKYVDWDEALMNAVRSDWAKVNKPANGADIFAGAR